MDLSPVELVAVLLKVGPDFSVCHRAIDVRIPMDSHECGFTDVSFGQLQLTEDIVERVATAFDTSADKLDQVFGVFREWIGSFGLDRSCDQCSINHAFQRCVSISGCWGFDT